MEYTDHVNMEEPKTCGNCKNKDPDCWLILDGLDNIEDCWQPIPEPVAITTWGPVNPAVTDAPDPQIDVDWLKWTQQLKSDIAKRDALIEDIYNRTRPGGDNGGYPFGGTTGIGSDVYYMIMHSGLGIGVK